MVFAASLGVMAVATLMLWGWGSAFQKMFGLERANWPATATLGMAAVVFLGGVLNLTRLAYPGALSAVVMAGVYLAWRDRMSFKMPPIALALLIGAVMIFTIATQLPPGIYNGHDDFQKYFAYPVRMQETGTVFGSPLSAMGTQTLGGQAFLDAFVVAFFPIVYVNGVDAIFGLFLCLMLASQLAGRLLEKLLGVASVVFIDPQYANISTLYCGSALIMAIPATTGAAPAGLIYAALIAMKPSFAVFVAIHFLASVRSMQGAVRTALATMAFLLPWILLNVLNYLAISKHPAPGLVPGTVETDSIHLFSFAPLEYGASAGSYTLLILAIAICGAICIRERKAAAVSVAGVVTFFVLIYALGPMHAGYEQSVRYFAPVAIGLAPVVFGLAAARNRFASIVAAIALAGFSPSLWIRAHSAWVQHSIWAYAWSTADQDYADYMQQILKGPERDTVKALQEKIPVGETILAWINAPFYLDYKRNRIIDIDPAGIGSPWAHVPQAQYLIWDYAGFATRDEEWYRRLALEPGASERRNAVLSLEFLKTVERMVSSGEVIFDTGEVKVVKLSR